MRPQALVALIGAVALASAGAKSPDECRQENAHLSGSQWQKAVTDCLRSVNAPVRQAAAAKSPAASQARASRNAKNSVGAKVQFDITKRNLAPEVAQPVKSKPAEPSSSGCYVGPRGGTYTITKSGRKNYGGC